MHHSGSTTDSLSAAWSGPNDGTRSLLSASVTNRFGEAWSYARLVFTMVDHDSSFSASAARWFRPFARAARPTSTWTA